MVGRYVSLISNDADIPLTLCQGIYFYIHQNENIIRKSSKLTVFQLFISDLLFITVHVLSVEDETEENVMSHSLCKKGDKRSDIDKWETSIFPEASIISMGGQCFLKHKSDEKVTKLLIAIPFIHF